MYYKRLNPLYFESSGRLVTVLGRESISNPNIALIEMVKNSYDADAEKVNVIFEDVRAYDKSTIIIEDDGIGMDENEIKENWMKVATDNKRREPFTKKYKRTKIGEKGVARIGLSTLSRKLEIVTKPEGSNKGYRMFINWDKFEEEGGSFEKVPIDFSSFQKKKNEHGMIIRLSNLWKKWDKEAIECFIREAELMIPPVAELGNFKITVHAPDFPDIGDKKIINKFLKIAPYYFDAKLKKDGRVYYRTKTLKEGWKKYSSFKTSKYNCGPVEFAFHFFYRDKSKYADLQQNIDAEEEKKIRSFLDNYGGVKLYRDNLRVKPFGDPGNDWLGLESLRINDPTVMPGNDQLFGYIRITKKDNSRIIDTSTRESIVDNPEFNDLKIFVRDAVTFFAQVRKSWEGKRGYKKKEKRVEKPGKIIEKIAKEAKQKMFIGFGNKYPEVFYFRLEDEANETFRYNLPNATLMLLRKMIENLVYNLLEEKFPSDINLRWDDRRSRPHEFGRLVSALSERAQDFGDEQKRLVIKLVKLIGYFRQRANLTTHQIIEYLDHRDELKALKIPEIIEILLKLIKKNKR